MKEKLCCFIGHRKIDITPKITERLKSVVKKLVDNGYTRFLFGSRGEFYEYAFDIVSEIKKERSEITRVGYHTPNERYFTEEEYAKYRSE